MAANVETAFARVFTREMNVKAQAAVRLQRQKPIVGSHLGKANYRPKARSIRASKCRLVQASRHPVISDIENGKFFPSKGNEGAVRVHLGIFSNFHHNLVTDY